MNRWLVMIPVMLCVGCAAKEEARTGRLVDLFYSHEYPAYRDAVRRAAADRNSANVVIDNLRLGIACLADGDPFEAESALGRAYEYLTSGGVNRPDRVVGSTLIYEGLKVWTGEPFEQAMAYYYIAAVSMLKGDWDDGRAAAVNALFALRGFKDHDPSKPTGKTIESQFVLGYLLAAVNAQLGGRDDLAQTWYARVLALRPEHQRLVEKLKSGDYDTLLLLDVGRGPIKQLSGEDMERARFVPDGRTLPTPTVSVQIDQHPRSIVGRQPLVDLWKLSQYPRWWSNERQRRTRRALGDVLLWGGLASAAVGAASDKDEVAWAGLGAAAAGAAMKTAAHADPRYLSCLPRCVFVVPLTLGSGRHGVSLHFDNDAGSDATWHELAGGRPGRPAVYFLRMHNAGGRGMPPWPDRPRYTTATTIGPRALEHYLFGGRDLTPPDDHWLQLMQQVGRLTETTAEQWRQLLRTEGLVFQPGPQGRTGPEALDKRLYRHVTEGGSVLWIPRPGTHLYERLTRLEHRPYVPRTAEMKQFVQRYGPRPADKPNAQPTDPPKPQPTDPLKPQPTAQTPSPPADAPKAPTGVE